MVLFRSRPPLVLGRVFLLGVVEYLGGKAGPRQCDLTGRTCKWATPADTSSMPSLGINELTYLMSLFTHHFSLGSFPLPSV